jgi:signal transduction histidine kinase/ABC-type amino acid transport substrate-binding protein
MIASMRKSVLPPLFLPARRLLPAVPALMLAVALLLGGAGAASPEETPLPRPLSEAGAEAPPSKAKRVVFFGGDHDGAPMEYIDVSGNPAGFVVDIMRAVGEEADLEVHFILSRWPEIRRGIMGDESLSEPPPPGSARLPLDVAALYFLPGRERFVDYTGSFLIEHSDIFVNRLRPVQVNVADPAGLKVGIMRGGFTYDWFRANHPAARLTLFDAETEALREVNNGNLDAAIVGQHTGRYAMRHYPLLSIRPEGKPFLARQYCLAVRKGDTELRDLLNLGLERIRTNGKYEEIYQRWFGGHPGAGLSTQDILGYLGMAVTPLVLIISAVLIWNAQLKRVVEGRTAELSKELAERRHVEGVLRVSEARFKELSTRFGAILAGIPQRITLLDREGEVVWTDAGGETSILPAGDLPVEADRSGHALQAHAPEVAPGSGSAPGDGAAQPGEARAAKPDIHCCRLAALRDGVCPDCIGLAALSQGRTLETRHALADGRTIEVTAFPIAGPDGEPQALVMTHDITEKILLQQEAQRASHLASLGELSAGVAHEINNPGGLILFNLSFLSQAFDEALPVLDEHYQDQPGEMLAGLAYERAREEIPAALSAILESARRIKRIVEDLRNFARPAATGSFAPVDLGQAARTALRLTANTLEKSQASVRLDIAPDTPPVHGNQHLIEQVLVNLLLNAAQALTAPGQGVFASARPGERPGQAVLEVRDEGRGMPPEVLAHAADPFYTTRRDTGGTGLGLSMTARILKEHGAELRILSQPGQGSAFVMTFPPSPAGEQHARETE